MRCRQIINNLSGSFQELIFWISSKIVLSLNKCELAGKILYVIVLNLSVWSIISLVIQQIYIGLGECINVTVVIQNYILLVDLYKYRHIFKSTSKLTYIQHQLLIGPLSNGYDRSNVEFSPIKIKIFLHQDLVIFIFLPKTWYVRDFLCRIAVLGRQMQGKVVFLVSLRRLHVLNKN